MLLTTTQNQIREYICLGQCSNGVGHVLLKGLGLEGNSTFSIICAEREGLSCLNVLFLFGYYILVVSVS